MKKSTIAIIMSIAIMGVSLCGCSKANQATSSAVETEPAVKEWEPIPVTEAEPSPEPEEEVIEEPEEEYVEGCYRSELTNEWIPEELKEQRPVAVMVDNEITALDHFGVNSCDIVYEIMNSTANNRITRLMCVVKDYNAISQLGSVRSTRPTNFMLAGEYDAILVHDGGPFYNDEYYARSYVDNLSGGFARIPNGKSSEFTEYVTPEEFTNSRGRTYDGLNKRIADAEYSVNYTDNYPGPHFAFSNADYLLSETYDDSQKVVKVDIPFPHNESKLVYNTETNTYDYYEYGKAHVDALNDNQVTSFKNAIIYSCSFAQLDSNGYLIYNVIGSGMDGYYLTNGEAIPIYWSKDTENGLTSYKSVATQEDIVLNTGKTYIAIVPDDSWKDLVLDDGEVHEEAADASEATSSASPDANTAG